MSDKLLNFIVGVTRLVEQAHLHEAQVLESLDVCGQQTIHTDGCAGQDGHFDLEGDRVHGVYLLIGAWVGLIKSAHPPRSGTRTQSCEEAQLSSQSRKYAVTSAA